ncbi:MAG TPA: DegT/DnrJ/EryC1/StrS family aminotransferase [Thermodesulfovibrionia bacterium]|nr:DegT/DnrJ/EryC1/StrS family aminotransferase [Thermodesulfovibrionia bacterium]
MNIPITKTYFGQEEAQAIQEPLKTGWVVQGAFCKNLRRQVCCLHRGAAHAIATTSCTTPGSRQSLI